MPELTPSFEALLLQWAVLVPVVIGALLLLGHGIFGRRAATITAAVAFCFPLLVALWLWWQFAGAAKLDGFAYLMPSLMELPGGGERVVFGLNLGLERVLGIRLAFGLNGISLPLFVLAGLVGFAAGWHALRNAPTDRRNLFLGLLVLMHGGLMGVFGSIDLFFFYFFHELALIPTFLMLGIWGRAGRRTVSMELTVYLTAGAMLSLIGIVALYASADGIAGFNFLALRRYLAAVPVEVALQENFFGLLLLGFGILVSLFPFHSWAPRAYATAPTANAMLHAGVLKKFGVYGLVQIAAVLLPEGLLPWRDWLVWLALGNVVLIGFATVAQTNLRQMIAYSSVMHMGYIFLGLAAFGSAGFGGAVMLMFAHGLSVSAMLLLADYIEDRTGSLDMGRIGGMAAKTPLLAGLFVAATFAGVGLPGFANFWGEFSVFLSLGEDYLWAVAPAGLGIVISAVYALRAVARIFFGQPTTEFRRAFDSGRLFDLAPAERVPAFVLIVALMFVGFWPRSVSDPIDAALPETPAARAELAEESR